MSSATVIVVEDEAIIRKDLVTTLEAMDYETLCAVSTGDDAIEKAREYEPDLVLMDISIPGTMDGVDAAGIIAKEQGIPVVFLTSYSDTTTIERAKQVHPYGYVLKPFTEGGLRAAIEIALSRHSFEADGNPGTEEMTVRSGEAGRNGRSRPTLSDIRTLFLTDFFSDIVLLIYNSPAVKELVFTSFFEKNIKKRGGIHFAYSSSKAHRKFQRETQQGILTTCRIKEHDLGRVTQMIRDAGREPAAEAPVPFRFIIDLSEPYDKREIAKLLDLILDLKSCGRPVHGILALAADCRDDDLAFELGKRIPRVMVTTGSGSAISCTGGTFGMEQLAFLSQPIVDAMVKKVLEPIILSFLTRPVTGSEILTGIHERYNVTIPKARVYNYLSLLHDQGYLVMRSSGKTRVYHTTEAGSVYIRQKLAEFNAVFHRILAETAGRESAARDR